MAQAIAQTLVALVTAGQVAVGVAGPVTAGAAAATTLLTAGITAGAIAAGTKAITPKIPSAEPLKILTPDERFASVEEATKRARGAIAGKTTRSTLLTGPTGLTKRITGTRPVLFGD